MIPKLALRPRLKKTFPEMVRGMMGHAFLAVTEREPPTHFLTTRGGGMPKSFSRGTQAVQTMTRPTLPPTLPNLSFMHQPSPIHLRLPILLVHLTLIAFLREA